MPVVLEWLKDWTPPSPRKQTGKGETGELEEAFDSIVAESEQEAKETMALVEGMEFGLDDKPPNSQGVGRTTASFNRPRLKAKPPDESRLFAHQLWATDSSLAGQMFRIKGQKPMWATEACVLLRDQGRCRVCGESVGTSWKVVRVVTRTFGGRWEEPNCVTVCKHCGTCWNSRRNFVTGTGLDGDFRRQRLYVMRRRLARYHDCKDLDYGTMELYRRLADEEDRQQRIGDERFQKVKERLVKAEHAGVEKVLELLKKSKAPPRRTVQEMNWLGRHPQEGRETELVHARSMPLCKIA